MFEKGLQGYQVEVGPLKPPRAQAWAPVRDGGYGVIINPKMYKPLYHAKLQKKKFWYN